MAIRHNRLGINTLKRQTTYLWVYLFIFLTFSPPKRYIASLMFFTDPGQINKSIKSFGGWAPMMNN